MDSRQLLMKCLILSKREAVLGHDISVDLINKTLSSIDTHKSEPSLVSNDRSMVGSIKQIIRDLMHNAVSGCKIMDESVLASVRLACGEDDYFYETVERQFLENLTEEDLKVSIIELRRSLQNHFRELRLSEIVSKAGYELKFKRDQIVDHNKFLTALISDLEGMLFETNEADPTITAELDISDTDSVANTLKYIKEVNDGSGVLSTGIQAVDEMLQGGLRPGDNLVAGALQHNFKTGLSLIIMMGVMLFNKPVLKDPNKKPLILSISFEDDERTNLQFIYQYLKGLETGREVGLSEISEKQMSEYVKEKLSKNGWHLKIIYVGDANMWTYLNVYNKILDYESQGYEVKYLRLDYLNLISKLGCNAIAGTGSDTRDLFRRIRAFTRPRGIVTYTPHQLSTQAMELKRMGTQTFLRDIAGKGYFDSCKTIGHEVDIEILIDRVKYNNRYWLEVILGKHRLPTVISDEKKNFFLPFFEVASIHLDKDAKNLAVRKLGAGTIGSDEEQAWFE